MNLHIENELDAYLDGELHAGKRRAVEAHLASCEVCRQALERRRALSALLQEWPVVSGPASAAEQARRVRAQLGPDRPERRSVERRTHWAWAALPLMLVAAWAFWATAAVLAPVVEALPGGFEALNDLLPAFQIGLPAHPLEAALHIDLQTLALPAAAGLGVPALLAALALLYLAWLSLLLARQRAGMLAGHE